MKKALPYLIAVLAGGIIEAIISPSLQARRGGLIGGEVLLPLLFLILVAVVIGMIELRKEAKNINDEDNDLE